MHILFLFLFLVAQANTVVISVQLSTSNDYQRKLAELFSISDRQKQFVLDAWLVKHAWVNPSMIFDLKNKERIVMVWKVPDKRKKDKIGYFWINSTNWESIRQKDWIEMNNSPGKTKSYLTGEDSRIFNHNGQLWLVYNTHHTKYKQLYYVPLQFSASDNSVNVLNEPLHVTYEGEVNVRHQKNWVPFDFCPQCMWDDRGTVDSSRSALQPNHHPANLFFVYSLQPHRIVETYPTNRSDEVDASTVFLTEIPSPQFHWAWGEMRGGTPALRVDPSHYLSFFHSSSRLSKKAPLTYVMGAYLFSSSPPFEITHVSPEPIMHQTFINESLGWASRAVDYIAFPMGFVIMDPFIYLSYGKNDRDSWILKLNKTGLLTSLKPVESVTLGTSQWDNDSGKVVQGSFKQFRNSSITSNSFHGDTTSTSTAAVSFYVPVSTSKEYQRKMAELFSMCDRQRQYVLDTWLVKHAWVNPSMIFDLENKEKIVMVWRVPDKKKKDKIGYFWINSTNWESIRQKDWIETKSTGTTKNYLVGEDSRIFNHNGQLWLVYNTHLTKYKQLYYVPLQFSASDNSVNVLNEPLHVTYEGEVNVRHQKNWSPFDFCPQCMWDDRGTVDSSRSALQPNHHPANLFFVYSLQPHRIVETYPTNRSDEVDASTVFLTEISSPQFHWAWGEMRGGTPALRVDPSHYLSFFHSSGRLSKKAPLTYVMGAYLFSSSPPFEITHVSPEPIMHQTFINVSLGWAYRAVDYIAFPMGFVIMDPFIYLSYGKNDRDSWILKLNKTGLLNSLKPVESVTLGASQWDKDSGKVVQGSFKQFRNSSIISNSFHGDRRRQQKYHQLRP